MKRVNAQVERRHAELIAAINTMAVSREALATANERIRRLLEEKAHSWKVAPKQTPPPKEDPILPCTHAWDAIWHGNTMQMQYRCRVCGLEK